MQCVHIFFQEKLCCFLHALMALLHCPIKCAVTTGWLVIAVRLQAMFAILKLLTAGSAALERNA